MKELALWLISAGITVLTGVVIACILTYGINEAAKEERFEED